MAGGGRGVGAGRELGGGRVVGEVGRRRSAQQVVERHTAMMPTGTAGARSAGAAGGSRLAATQRHKKDLDRQERDYGIVPCVDSEAALFTEPYCAK